MEYQTTEVDGVPIRWLEVGEGFPVVFVHGIPASAGLWRHVIPKVSGVRCLAFEMVGYGRSIPAGVGRDISVAKQADYLLGWLRKLDIQRAILVGHDLGGGVVQIAAVRDRSICAGLVLTNCISRDSWPVPQVRTAARLGGVLRHLPNRLFNRIFPAMVRSGHETREQAREAAAVHGAEYVRHAGAAAFVRQVSSLRTEDTVAVANELASLDVPARVVWGTADEFQTVEYGELLARDLGVELRRIEGGRHFTPEDHPDVIAAAVIEVIELVRERS